MIIEFLGDTRLWNEVGEPAMTRTFFPLAHFYTRVDSTHCECVQRPDSQWEIVTEVARPASSKFKPVPRLCASARDGLEIGNNGQRTWVMRWSDISFPSLPGARVLKRVSMDFVFLEELSRNWTCVAQLRDGGPGALRCPWAPGIAQPLQNGDWLVPCAHLAEFVADIGPHRLLSHYPFLASKTVARADLSSSPYRVRRNAFGVKVPPQWVFGADLVQQLATDACPGARTVLIAAHNQLVPYRTLIHNLPTAFMARGRSITQELLADAWSKKHEDVALRLHFVHTWVNAKLAWFVTEKVRVLSLFGEQLNFLASYAQALGDVGAGPSGSTAATVTVLQNREKDLSEHVCAWEVAGRQLQQLAILLSQGPEIPWCGRTVATASMLLQVAAPLELTSRWPTGFTYVCSQMGLGPVPHARRIATAVFGTPF